ncbi:MAG: MFS transporter [Thermoproteota archaeon]|nr:MFS transporter [Thermoproteota archaeon]
MNNEISKDAWVSLIILSSIALLTMYGETMLLPAIPELVKDFKITYNISSWILTAYLITGAVMTPVAGKLSDVYGKKKVLIIIMAIYAAGTLLGGLSTNIISMIVARIIMGIGLAIFPVAFGIIREKFPEKKLAIGQGLFTAVFSGGAVIGLGLGATIVEHFGWRMTFLSIIPFAIILLFIKIKFIHVNAEKLLSKIDSSVVDVKGTLTLIVMISSFLIALTLLPNSISYSDTNNLIFTILLFVLSAALFPLFISIQKKSKSPLINVQLLKDVILFPTNILIMTIGISIFIIYQSLPILIQSPTPLGFGGGPVESASVQLPFMILSLIISVSSGFLISKIGNIKPTIVGCIISTIGFFLIFIYHPTEFVISIELSIIAIGLSLAEIGSFNIILVSTPLHLSGTSLGITMLLFLIGMSVGPTISGIYLQSFQTSIKGVSGTFPSTFSYNMIFLTAALISVFSIILTAMVARKPLHGISQENQY